MRRTAVFTFICSITFLLGCLTFNDDPVEVSDDLTPYDVELRISSTENNVFCQDDPIGLIVELINNGEVDIRLETYLLNYPGIQIKNPHGYRFTLFHGNITVAPDYKEFKAGGYISSTVDLKENQYFNGTSYTAVSMDWTIKGVYTCNAAAYRISSNEITFEMT